MSAVSMTVQPCHVQLGISRALGKLLFGRISERATYDLDGLAESLLAFPIVALAVRKAHACRMGGDGSADSDYPRQVGSCPSGVGAPMAPKPGSGSSVPSGSCVVLGML